MKKHFIIGDIILALALVIIVGLKMNLEYEKIIDNKEIEDDYSVIHIPQSMFRYMTADVYKSPSDFCASHGSGTFLAFRYSEAFVDPDGCLVLKLNNKAITAWKNSFLPLQVLQCVLKDTRDIGVTIDYSMDFLDMMKNAHTCGHEISEDFTKVIEGPGDNTWYSTFILPGCVLMQIFEGRDCADIGVEQIWIDEQGEVIETFFFPDGDDVQIIK